MQCWMGRREHVAVPLLAPRAAVTKPAWPEALRRDRIQQFCNKELYKPLSFLTHSVAARPKFPPPKEEELAPIPLLLFVSTSTRCGTWPTWIDKTIASQGKQVTRKASRGYLQL